MRLHPLPQRLQALLCKRGLRLRDAGAEKGRLRDKRACPLRPVSYTHLTINIGKRQKGRVRGNSVIDINCNQEEIEDAIQKIIDSNVDEREIYNPYYLKDTAENYFKTTKIILENLTAEPKKFYDISMDYK